mmetsp:Transcript_16344/g.33357  ORF Transcript_16344/g.33357 Transcript_16344/m.33357 type:complete len:103 (+) Transcript_16344:178-486(+)
MIFLFPIFRISPFLSSAFHSNSIQFHATQRSHDDVVFDFRAASPAPTTNPSNSSPTPPTNSTDPTTTPPAPTPLPPDPASSPSSSTSPTSPKGEKRTLPNWD